MLRIDEKGLVVKVEAPDGPEANTSTDLLLTLALRQRDLAADIADAYKPPGRGSEHCMHHPTVQCGARTYGGAGAVLLWAMT